VSETIKAVMDRKVACGEFPRASGCSTQGCGARNWSVLKMDVLADDERKLVCRECGFFCFIFYRPIA